MENDTHIGMNDKDSEQKPEWPREVLIKQTLEFIAAELGDDYDEDEDNGLVATAVMDSTKSIEIESWEEIPKGCELVSQDDKEACQAYLDSKQQESTEGNYHASQRPSSVGTIRATELKHGKSYDCTIDGDLGPEDCSFVQLAIDVTSNRRFMLLGARHLFSQNVGFVHKLIGMSLNELDTEDFDGSPDRVMGLQVWEFLLDDNGSLKAKSQECYLDGFTETDVIKCGPKS
jgi:hypothetical protein